MAAVIEVPDAVIWAFQELVIAAPEGRLNPTDQDVQLDEVLLSTVTLAVNPPAHWLPMVIVTPHVPVVTGAAVVVTGAAVVVTGAAVVVTGAAVVVAPELVGAAVVVVVPDEVSDGNVAPLGHRL